MEKLPENNTKDIQNNDDELEQQEMDQELVDALNTPK